MRHRDTELVLRIKVLVSDFNFRQARAPMINLAAEGTEFLLNVPVSLKLCIEKYTTYHSCKLLSIVAFFSVVDFILYF